MDVVVWNPQGYRLTPLRVKYDLLNPFGKTIYDFQLYLPRPATLQIEPHTFIQPDRHMETDLGSTAWLKTWAPSDRYPLQYCFHDSPDQDDDDHHGRRRQG